jgi:predicted Fe-S protein YdhL (DUF1289 family)
MTIEQINKACDRTRVNNGEVAAWAQYANGQRERILHIGRKKLTLLSRSRLASQSQPVLFHRVLPGRIHTIK